MAHVNIYPGPEERFEAVCFTSPHMPPGKLKFRALLPGVIVWHAGYEKFIRRPHRIEWIDNDEFWLILLTGLELWIQFRRVG